MGKWYLLHIFFNIRRIVCVYIYLFIHTYTLNVLMLLLELRGFVIRLTGCFGGFAYRDSPLVLSSFFISYIHLCRDLAQFQPSQIPQFLLSVSLFKTHRTFLMESESTVMYSNSHRFYFHLSLMNRFSLFGNVLNAQKLTLSNFLLVS